MESALLLQGRRNWSGAQGAIALPLVLDNQFHHHVLLIATSDFQTFRRLCAIKLHGHSDCFL